jgi:hypothetical protein
LLTLIAQLTAARLNLNATAELADANCSDFEFNDESIEDILAAAILLRFAMQTRGPLATAAASRP